MIEFDISNANPEDVNEYIAINERIDALTPDDIDELKLLLKRRAKVMSRLLGANIYPVKD